MIYLRAMTATASRTAEIFERIERRYSEGWTRAEFDAFEAELIAAMPDLTRSQQGDVLSGLYSLAEPEWLQKRDLF